MNPQPRKKRLKFGNYSWSSLTWRKRLFRELVEDKQLYEVIASISRGENLKKLTSYLRKKHWIIQSLPVQLVHSTLQDELENIPNLKKILPIAEWYGYYITVIHSALCLVVAPTIIHQRKSTNLEYYTPETTKINLDLTTDLGRKIAYYLFLDGYISPIDIIKIESQKQL